MGKKRIIKKRRGRDAAATSRALARVPQRKDAVGTLKIRSTFNNTILTLCDNKGNTLISASSGTLGFKGSRKSTPFAAAKVGEIIGDKAVKMNMKDANVVIRGVGAGRESALRGFSSKGVAITKIADETPVPHNGPRPPKPRRI